MKNEQKKLALNAILFSMDSIRKHIEIITDGVMLDSDINEVERLSNAIKVLSEAWKNVEGSKI